MAGKNGRVVGIDIGGTMTKLGLFDEEGSLLARHAMPTPSSSHGPIDIAYVGEGVAMLGREGGLPGFVPERVGIGMPMLVTPQGNITRCFNVLMDDAQMHLSLARMFPGVPVEIVNDANAAVLGESWQGSLWGRSSGIMLTLGTGVGGGMVIGGRLVPGAHGAAGEFGHITVNHAETERCACGRKGCLEQYVSATGLVRSARQAIASGAPTSLDGHAFDARAVCDAARAGDELARRLLDRFASQLAAGLATLAAVFDPEVLVLGGGLSLGADVFLEETREAFRAEALDACSETPVLRAELANDAGMFGAAYLALRGKAALCMV